MPDSYAHKFNAKCALNIANYKPRNYETFMLGCNGPDPLFFHRMYSPLSKVHLSALGTKMHNEKTGLFLQNLFRYAQTNAQKDFCLGFLCHYSLDSILHPYINYVTTAYGNPFNREHGHAFFESSLDSIISHAETGNWAASPDEYFPEIKKMYIDQIVTLFKQAVEATYPEEQYNRDEYLQAFKDFKSIKNTLLVKHNSKRIVAMFAEKLLKMDNGFILSHMQPCRENIDNIAIWRNNATGFFCISDIQQLFEIANQMSANYIEVGLMFFNGEYSINDLLEDIGNKSYETGVTIN